MLLSEDSTLTCCVREHNRGDPNKGPRVWVFKMVERSSNIIILYPVQNHSAGTLLHLIQRHVVTGSTI